MILGRAAFLLDENIHPNVGDCLESLGVDVVMVQGSDLAGTDDRTILERAYVEGRVVVTHDADFGTLAITQGAPVLGVVYLRPGHISPEFTIGSLRTVFQQTPEVEPPFIIVAKRSGDTVTIRVRQL